MSKKDLLKHANDKKPVEFTKEFKSQLDKAVQLKLNPEMEETIDDDGDDDNGDDDE